MKAKCIKADPLGWLEIGTEYECTERDGVIIITGTGFAMSRECFDVMFDDVRLKKEK
jgi:hypothetical protein